MSNDSIMCRAKVPDITDIFLLFNVMKIPIIYEPIKFVRKSVSFTEIIFVKRDFEYKKIFRKCDKVVFLQFF